MIEFSSQTTAQILELACTLQQIPAPTFNEQPRLQFLRGLWQNLGFDSIQMDAAGNLLACLPGSGGRPLVLTAHADTVHPLGTDLTLTREADRLLGPAIGDNSLGVAAMTHAVLWLRENGFIPPGDLWFAATVGEEGLGNLSGVRAVVERFQAKPVAYIHLEGMGLGSVFHRGLGVQRYQITVRTAGGHSWANYGSPSAIHAIAQLVTAFTQIPIPTKPRTSLNVGKISGGISVNSIASQASLELDLRSENPQSLGQLIQAVQNLIQNAQRPGIEIDTIEIGSRPAGEIPESHPLVQLAVRALTECGQPVYLSIASTEANIPLSLGLPSVCVGITHGGSAHTLQEWIALDPISIGFRQVLTLLTQAWQTA